MLYCTKNLQDNAMTRIHKACSNLRPLHWPFPLLGMVSHTSIRLLCLFFGSLLKCLLLCESFSNYSGFNSNKFYTIPPSYTHSFHHPFYFHHSTYHHPIYCVFYSFVRAYAQLKGNSLRARNFYFFSFNVEPSTPKKGSWH